MNVDLKAVAERDGSVTCHVKCDGRQAKINFAPGEVIMTVPSTDGEVTMTVPEAPLRQRG